MDKAIKRTYHNIPALEEISHELAGATVFSKLDAKRGYWSISLDNASNRLCAFNSPAGKFRFCRLPFWGVRHKMYSKSIWMISCNEQVKELLEWQMMSHTVRQ